MPDRVVDASVIAAFAFGEARADEARDLIAEATLFAPEILPYEFASVALKKSRSLPSFRFDIAMRLRAALSLGVKLVRIPPLELIALSLKTNLTIYDAAYLEAARLVRCPLLTFDAKLARQARTTRA
ncbi:MAG TPA: type II toxin-antitoxin system VapC family toxin [Candidatus Acidoferrum sp.]|nr:type II toxin-antitoxin system VapC family toxin [Candidatus Acidoferrum sp.]